MFKIHQQQNQQSHKDKNHAGDPISTQKKPLKKETHLDISANSIRYILLTDLAFFSDLFYWDKLTGRNLLQCKCVCTNPMCFFSLYLLFFDIPVNRLFNTTDRYSELLIDNQKRDRYLNLLSYARKRKQHQLPNSCIP